MSTNAPPALKLELLDIHSDLGVINFGRGGGCPRPLAAAALRPQQSIFPMPFPQLATIVAKLNPFPRLRPPRFRRHHTFRGLMLIYVLF